MQLVLTAPHIKPLEIFLFLRKQISIDLILPYTDVCIALYTQCIPGVCEKNFTGDSGRIQTHDLLLISANVLTSRPPSKYQYSFVETYYGFLKGKKQRRILTTFFYGFR